MHDIIFHVISMVFVKNMPPIFFYLLFINRSIKVESTIENVILNIKMQKANFQIHVLK